MSRYLPIFLQSLSKIVPGRYSTEDNLHSDVLLKLSVDTSNTELFALYKAQVERHNDMVHYDPYANSGFDLFVPRETIIRNDTLCTMIPMDIKCEMLDANLPTGYFMFPRSSISKTPLMLANHTGIIDAGYRGTIIGAFRNLLIQSDAHYTVEKHSRLVQICHPGLKPFYVTLVNETELSSTVRDKGGFGSTGK